MKKIVLYKKCENDNILNAELSRKIIFDNAVMSLYGGKHNEYYYVEAPYDEPLIINTQYESIRLTTLSNNTVNYIIKQITSNVLIEYDLDEIYCHVISSDYNADMENRIVFKLSEFNMEKMNIVKDKYKDEFVELYLSPESEIHYETVRDQTDEFEDDEQEPYDADWPKLFMTRYVRYGNNEIMALNRPAIDLLDGLNLDLVSYNKDVGMLSMSIKRFNESIDDFASCFSESRLMLKPVVIVDTDGLKYNPCLYMTRTIKNNKSMFPVNWSWRASFINMIIATNRNFNKNGTEFNNPIPDLYFDGYKLDISDIDNVPDFEDMIVNKYKEIYGDKLVDNVKLQLFINNYGEKELVDILVFRSTFFIGDRHNTNSVYLVNQDKLINLENLVRHPSLYDNQIKSIIKKN